jgi:hypothetical protein
MIHAMLDNYLLEGRPFTRLFHSSRIWDTLLRPGSPAAKLLSLPWNVVFPLSSPDRYKLRYQLERIPRLLRRLLILSHLFSFHPLFWTAFQRLDELL